MPPVLIRGSAVAGPVKRSLAIILCMVVVIAAVTLVGARPGPVFSLSGVSAQRSCFYNTTQGNYSSWSVYFNVTNRGTSASAAVVISIDGAGLFDRYYFVPSGGTVGDHQVLSDRAIATDPACLQHNVTVGLGGYTL